MAVGQVYRLAVRSTFNNVDDIINVHHYRQELVVIGNPAEDLANQWASDLALLYRGLFGGGVSLTDVSVRPVPPATEFFDLNLGSQAGLLAGQTLPLPNAPIITWRTALIGRRNRGRTFFPPPTENEQDGGSISATLISALQDYADGAIQLLELGVPQWQMVVHSEVGGTDNPVTSYVVRTLMGSQRRRKQGVGG